MIRHPANFFRASLVALVTTVSTQALSQTVAVRVDPAQSPASPSATRTGDAADSGDIVVTARRVSETLQDVPLSVSAIGGLQTEANRAFTLESIDGLVPSVKVFQTVGQTNAYAIFIRGIGRDNGNFNVEAPVALYVDDVYYPFQIGPVIDLGGIDHIEVLRGPQGTLYGRNATVGAVKYVSTRPDLNDFNGRLNVTGGSYGRAEVNGGVSVPIVPGEVGLKVDAGYRSYGGFMFDRGAKKKLGGVSTVSGKASLLYKPSPTFELYVAGDATHSRNEPAVPTPFTFTAATATPVFGTYIGERSGGDLNKLDAGGGTVQAKLELGDITLRSISAYRTFHFGFITDGTGGIVPNAWSQIDTQDDTFSQEFQSLGSVFDDRLTFVGGVLYLRSDTDGRITRATRTSRTKQVSESSAAYVDATLKITPRLHASAGIRHTKDRKRAEQGVNSSNAAFTASGSQEWSATTTRFSLDYQITDDILAYAIYGEGFKGGQLNSLEPATAAVANVFVPPEKASNKEIGLKTQWLDKAVTLNLNYFWTDYTDQTQAILINQISTLVFADAKLSGFEAEATVRPVRNWVFSGSLSTLDGVYTDVEPGHPAFTDPNKRLKQAPELSYRVDTHYTVDDVFNGKLTFGGGLNYVSGTYQSVTKNALTYQKPYTVLNVDATYSFADERYAIAFAGTNVTNTEYFKIVTNPYVRWYSAPAEYTLTFKVRF